MPYFDHNATTPLSPAARAAWLRATEEAWQNPSSPHRAGARVRLRLDAARKRLAEFLDTVPERLVFTGGATEAAHAIVAHLAGAAPAASRLLLNPTEHPCVLAAARRYFGEDRMEVLPLNTDGVVKPEAVRTALRASAEEGRPVAALVVMAANNETGVLQPWRELAQVARDAAVPFVCDASQWLGKLPASGFGEMDWVFGAAHKFGAPKGVGLLQRPLDANGLQMQPGGGQEQGQRGGTENFPAIAAMVAALAEAEQTLVMHETERVLWRDRFERELTLALPGTRVIAAGADRLWNTVALCLPFGENSRWVARLDQRGFEVATGSACATGDPGPSHVLAALGLSPEEARRIVRISSGWSTTPADWEQLRIALLAAAVEVRPNAAVVSP